MHESRTLEEGVQSSRELSDHLTAGHLSFQAGGYPVEYRANLVSIISVLFQGAIIEGIDSSNIFFQSNFFPSFPFSFFFQFQSKKAKRGGYHAPHE